MSAMQQALPLVALVGRPNVGKSTLFNRMVGSRTALVDDRPGVTRDRLFGECRHEDRIFRVVDTGGFELDTTDQMLLSVREQAQLAVDEADLVLFVLDAEAGVQAADHDIVELLRKANKPVIAVANKVDTQGHEERVGELYELGLESVLPVSAEHARGVAELCDLIVERLNPPLEAAAETLDAPIPVSDVEPAAGQPSAVEWDGKVVRVAVIGRPNVGKSSMVNRLLGEKRLVESPVAGTTRDAIDTSVTVDNQDYVLIDTAGIRRKFSIAERLERFAVMVAVRSLDRADIALVVLDGGEGPSDQDARILGLAAERGKGIVLVINKSDLIKEDKRKDSKERVRWRFPFVPFAPLVVVSAKTGRGMEHVLPTALTVQRERHRRVATGELNRFFAEVVERHPPPIAGGKRPRLYFVTQPMIRPPTFVFAASHSSEIPESYRRYLANALRERFGFEGTPIWVKFRPHRKELPKTVKRGQGKKKR